MTPKINIDIRFFNCRKVTLLQLFVLSLSSPIYAQRVFPVKFSNQADVKVYEVKFQNQADLLVYHVDFQNQVVDCCGLWYYTDFVNQAQWKIFFTHFPNQADLKIFYVKFCNQAGWRNEEKKRQFCSKAEGLS